MPLVAARRELARRAIQMNPAQVALKRATQTPDGAGGFTESTSTLPAQTVRLFISSNRGSRDVSEVGGQMQFNQLGLLAEYDADVQRGDMFERDGRHYKVEKVDHVSLLGEVVSIQAVLEEVV